MDVCRFCLSKSPDKHIDQLKTSKKEGERPYQEILPFCLDIEVTEEVQITKKICTKCFNKVLSFYTFKSKVLKNEAYLRSRIAQMLVKSEPLDEEEVYLPQLPLKGTLECVQNNMKFESDNNENEIDLKPESPYLDDQLDHCHDYQQDYNVDKHEVKKKILKVDLNEHLMTPQTKDLQNMKTKKDKVKTKAKISTVKSKVYPCEFCDKVFKQYGGKYKHTKFFHLNIKSHCNICNKDVADLKDHTLVTHKQYKMKHKCGTCNSRFISKTKLNRHKCKSEGAPEELTSSRCKAKSEHHVDLLVHTNTVHEEERQFLCDYCSNGFVHKISLILHIQNMHLRNISNSKQTQSANPIIRKKGHNYNINLKGYPCDVCSKVLTTVSGKFKHMKYVHMNYRKQCSICDKRVIFLNKHMQSIHGKDDRSALRYKCELCARRFDQAHKLRNHVCAHATNVNQYDCPECDKQFPCMQKLRMHIRRVHKGEKNFMCHFCSKSFFHNCALIRHIRTHTKEKPYKCTVCNGSYSCSKSLKNHMYVHENKAAFQCQVCDKKFVSPRYLSVHMAVHRSEKKHPCKYCGVRFVRSDHRKRHEFTAHEKYIAAEPK